MSVAHAVAHGAFGRACLYALDKAMVPHAHREGHLIFHIDGPPAEVVVDGYAYPLSAGEAVAVSPWRSHYYRPIRQGSSVLSLVLYIRPEWFAHAGRQASDVLRFGRIGVDVSDQLARLIAETGHMLGDTGGFDQRFDDRLNTLTQTAYDQTWRWSTEQRQPSGQDRQSLDFRIRKAIRLLDENISEPIDLARLSRAAGLSRPHFFKLFREQIGLPPTIYVNALRMERAITRLAAGVETVADIGLDLGFSTPASFSRFFIANGVVPPSAYRRSILAQTAP